MDKKMIILFRARGKDPLQSVEFPRVTEKEVYLPYLTSYEPGYGNQFVVVVCLGLTSLSTIFQSYNDSVDRELNAHFYSAASWHDTTPSHITLTLVDQS